MRAFSIVFNKEVTDNFRDKRTLLTALVGPLFGPILFVAIMSMSLTRAISDSDKPLELPVLNAETAPSLIAFLEQENVTPKKARPTREETIAAVRNGELELAVIFPEGFSDKISRGEIARIEVIADQSNSQSGSRAGRAQGLINAWGRQIGSLRLSVRGVDPSITRPLQVEVIDTSTPSGRSALILGMLTYFMLFSMLMGGMYLAIDSTAGERERGSLEPLLSLPVSRSELIVGKIAAACVYMLVSLAVSLAAFVVAIKFLPLEKLGMTANFGPMVGLKSFLVIAPFSLLGAALMTAVASFTKSYKEAQTYMTFVMLLPTIPIIIAAVLTLRPSLPLMTIPSLSQHLLVTEIMKDQPLDMIYLAVSEITTLLLGIALTFIATRLYRREGLLV